jgi:hypothetical protein
MNARIANRFYLSFFHFFPWEVKKSPYVQPFLKCTTLVVRIFELKINPNIQPMVYLQTFIQMLYCKIEPGLKNQARKT